MLPTFSQSYRPLYFLSALGMGGLAVSFFMYLMFLTKHPKTPLPTSRPATSPFPARSPHLSLPSLTNGNLAAALLTAPGNPDNLRIPRITMGG